MLDDRPHIRNSTIDFLIFTKDSRQEGIEVRVQDNNVWLTQKAIAQLFDVDRSVVTKHLKKILESGELDENTTRAFFAQVADNGKTYQYKFYALPAIIAVGYRINSQRATQFRQWATKVLDTFTKQGYVLDKDRLINGQVFEANRFKTISDFKWCVNYGGEVEFEWKGLSYGIWPKLRKTPDAPLQMLISQIYIDNPASTEKWCDTSDELLEYMVSGDRLRDVITQVTVWDRSI